MLQWCFVSELHIPTRDNRDSAANENQGSRGRTPSPQPTWKNHETGFGKKTTGF